MTRESGSQGNDSRMYMTQECVHDVKRRTKRCIMANSHDSYFCLFIFYFKTLCNILIKKEIIPALYNYEKYFIHNHSYKN
jgi:hypothetical protein